VRASALMLMGALLSSVDAAIIKAIATDLHPLQIYFFRCLLALVVIAPFMLRHRIEVRRKELPVHLVRAVLKLIGIVTLMFAITLLPLATVTAIGFVTPLFVSLGAMLWFRERASLRALVCLAIGFAGVLVVIRPTSGFGEIGALVALAAALVTALANLMTKHSSTREPAMTVVLLNLVISVPIALAVALPFWTWPSVPLLGLLLVQGSIAAACQLCYVGAYALADASKLMPLDFLRLPAAIVIAYFIFMERPDLWTIVGAVVIFAAGLASLRAGRTALLPSE
jgi:drug/metabolite transporter (DMT)-like permease